eukprot:363698-Chlamydomonas_euryale.AAC.5
MPSAAQAPGRIVVRLKGGDPAVFSRVSSEAAALSAAGVPYEMVPGVSSALAAQLLAGGPLTDATATLTRAPLATRPGQSGGGGGGDGDGDVGGDGVGDQGSGGGGGVGGGKGAFAFAVVSGHDVPGTDWAALSGVPTLVVLLAGRSLAALADVLVARGGRCRETPVVLVRSAGLPDQRIWRGTLGTIAADTHGERLSPCVFTVGAVAALPDAWQAAAAAHGLDQRTHDSSRLPVAHREGLLNTGVRRAPTLGVATAPGLRDWQVPPASRTLGRAVQHWVARAPTLGVATAPGLRDWQVPPASRTLGRAVQHWVAKRCHVWGCIHFKAATIHNP